MGRTLTICRKELHHIFLSPIAYAFLLVFSFFVTFMFMRAFFLYGQATLSNFFFWMPLAFAIVIPGVTMRMWSEERKQGTVELLLTSPVETWQIVLGKFLAGLVLVLCCVLLTLFVPYYVSDYGDLDPGPVWGGYLGAVLMGGTCIAVGMFLSAFAQDQIVSFLVSVSVLMTLVFLGLDYIQTEFAPGSFFGRLAHEISPTTHFESIGRGVIDLRDLYYFVGTAALFLYLNVRVIDLRRWK